MKYDVQYDYKQDVRGPGDGCRVCTGKLEIDEDGDLVCYYCNTVAQYKFNYDDYCLAKLKR
jgi:hypothetical protein